jgi:hypothetical protein
MEGKCKALNLGTKFKVIKACEERSVSKSRITAVHVSQDLCCKETVFTATPCWWHICSKIFEV